MKDIIYDFNYFQNKYPNIVKLYSFTKQDKEWHAEGNVAIHTEMVLKELLSNPYYETISEDSKKIVAYACFFHDLGKPYTTKEENGRIVSPNHSKVGEKEFRKLFFDIDFEFRESVAMLIRYHGYPIHYYDKKEHDIVRLAEIVNLKLLYLLAMSDMKGRISDPEEQEQHIYSVDYFKDCSRYYGCYSSPKEFETPEHKLRYIRTGEEYAPFVEKRSNVYLMVGIPGSGKDYYVNNNLSDIESISYDKFRHDLGIKHGDKKGTGQIIQASKKRAKELMAKDTDFVWNATNLMKDRRGELIDLFMSYGATVHIVYVERPLKTILVQNKDREYSLPSDKILDYLAKVDIPTNEEAHTLTLVIG